MQEILIKADHLSKTYTSGKKRIKAVDDICFEIPRGTTMSLVGESGSGKSTTGRMILRLLQPDTGSVFYNGIEITSKNISEFRSRMQIIFQSSSSSLDPALRIGDIIAEGLHPSGVFKKKGSDDGIVSSLLSSVGLSASDAQRYPREFSGGQQQRIGIARALAVEPEFIVCDEPVSALDVSCQSQILNLLLDLQAKKNMTYLFISHDLSVVTQISDTIGVMYAGKLVETGSCEEIFTHRQHPYTKMLFSSVPIPDPVKARARTRVILDAETAGGNAGCPFFSRCANALPCCRETKPALREIAPGHKCACHLFE